MNFPQQMEPYFSQGADLRLRQQVYRPNILVDKKIWPRLWNLFLLLSSILLAANLWLSHRIADLDQTLQAQENLRHELTESQISLRATRDHLHSADYILAVASQKMALHVPDREQVNALR